ncbi:ABCC9 [Mytilus coruscus]|uniref:ABCC9 n=1 Tax=Mytilus coruscus TaxID=42192 RepID=A0A6J8F0K3_MYTCO|nr:unnamed protein product [Mytilus coruscus]CAC5426429.1 ABCC9 [Mytilus coruscus]
MWVTWIDIAMYLILLLTEIIFLFIQRYAFFSNPIPVRPSPDLGKSDYIFSHVNLLSKITCFWILSLLRQGYKHPLEQENLGDLPESELSSTNYKKLKAAFEFEKSKAELKGEKPSFHKIYLRAFWPILALAGLLRLFGDMLAFVGPWCVEHVVAYAYKETKSHDLPVPLLTNQNASLYGYQDNLSKNFTLILNQMNSTQIIHYLTVSEFLQNGYILCVVLFIATIVQLSLLQYHYFLVIREGIRVKTALQTIIYKKSLTISGLVISGGKMTIGSIMNHMTLDTLFIMMLFFLFHYIWAAPLQVMVAIILLYFKLGVSAVIGASIFILAAPLQYYIARQMSVQQKKVMSNADNRVKKCNEMVQSMRVIKLLAWEKICQKTINQSRKPELWALFRAAVFRIFFNFAGVAIPILGTMITFILYPYLEDEPQFIYKNLFQNINCQFNYINNYRYKSILYSMKDAEGFNTGDKHKTHTIGTETMDNKPLKVGVVVEGVNGTGKPVTVLQNEMSSSQSSLESNLSRTPGHSRQNSHTSLKDIMELKERRHSEPNKTGSLTVNDKKETSGRQRHTSGVSTEDEDEIAEKFTLIEARMVVEINNGSFSWDLSTQEPALNDINVKIPTGKLTIIVGSVGSGKTSLLSAMLGEMLTIKGEVNWHKGSKLAYAAQKAWLLHDTLRDNVLFGLPYTWRRYKSVIHSCALQADLDIYNMSNTMLVDGINLSGGQKQRISIARALYSKADTVLLDDPFSALDAHVGKHVFEEAILNRMLKKKRTVILVTHQLQYLSYASHVSVGSTVLVTHQLQYLSYASHVSVGSTVVVVTHQLQYLRFASHVSVGSTVILVTHQLQYLSYASHVSVGSTVILVTHQLQYLSYASHVSVGSTVILVTHQLQYLSYASHVSVGSTVILVTHQLQYLSYASHVSVGSTVVLVTHQLQYLSYASHVSVGSTVVVVTHQIQYLSYASHVSVVTHQLQYLSYASHVSVGSTVVVVTHQLQYLSYASRVSVGSTVILVTHQLQYLSYASHVSVGSTVILVTHQIQYLSYASHVSVGSTVILVTHQLQYLSYASHVSVGSTVVVVTHQLQYLSYASHVSVGSTVILVTHQLQYLSYASHVSVGSTVILVTHQLQYLSYASHVSVGSTVILVTHQLQYLSYASHVSVGSTVILVTHQLQYLSYASHVSVGSTVILVTHQLQYLSYASHVSVGSTVILVTHQLQYLSYASHVSVGSTVVLVTHQLQYLSYASHVSVGSTVILVTHQLQYLSYASHVSVGSTVILVTHQLQYLSYASHVSVGSTVILVTHQLQYLSYASHVSVGSTVVVVTHQLQYLSYASHVSVGSTVILVTHQLQYLSYASHVSVGSTVILVTHQLQYLSYASHVSVGSTVILVTHQLQYLSYASHVSVGSTVILVTHQLQYTSVMLVIYASHVSVGSTVILVTHQLQYLRFASHVSVGSTVILVTHQLQFLSYASHVSVGSTVLLVTHQLQYLRFASHVSVGSTVILVTHQLQYLSYASRVSVGSTVILVKHQLQYLSYASHVSVGSTVVVVIHQLQYLSYASRVSVGSTVILVTHQLQYLSYASHVSVGSTVILVTHQLQYPRFASHVSVGSTVIVVTHQLQYLSYASYVSVGSTVILVTHQLQYLRYASHVSVGSTVILVTHQLQYLRFASLVSVGSTVVLVTHQLQYLSYASHVSVGSTVILVTHQLQYLNYASHVSVGSTVILVTHQLQYLRYASHVSVGSTVILVTHQLQYLRFASLVSVGSTVVLVTHQLQYLSYASHVSVGSTVILVTHQLQYLSYASHVSVGSTVILVTHQLQYLRFASLVSVGAACMKRVIVMKEGGIQYQGKLHDVKKVNPELYESWRKALREASTIEPRESERPSESSTEMRVGSPHLEGRKHSYPSITELQHQSSVSFSSNTLGRQLSQFSYNEEEEEPVIEFKEQDIEENDQESEASPLKNNAAEKDGKFIKKEHQEKGAVKAIVYLHYVKACGTGCVLLVLSLLVSYYALLVGSNFWLSVWSEDSTEFNTQLKAFQQLGNSTNMTAPIFNNTYYTNIYVALSISGIMAALLAGLVLYVVGIRASRNLHKLMLDTILHVPGRFFDTNPSGRIINRFSNDMGQVDQKLPNILDNFLGCLFTTLCAVIVNTITTPYFILAAIPLFILYYLIQLFFRASARELQRLDNTTKSPIFSHFSETLNGLQTIRAYRAEKRFFSKVMNLINKNNTPFLYLHTANRWLGVNLDYLGSIQVLFAAIVTLSTCLAGSTSPAFVGLGITYALQVSFYLNWIVRMSTETEMLMNSVERVHEYTKLEREPDKHPDGNLIVDESWPEKGR